MLSSVRDALMAIAYPSFCKVCTLPVRSWRDGGVCAACWTLSAWPSELPLCEKCGVPVASPGPSRCGWCESLSFAAARACGPYSGGWRESVLWLKRFPHVAPRIVDAMRLQLGQISLLHRVDVLLPVPLHPERERRRGFNQAQIIAEALSHRTGLRVDTASMIRVSGTTRHRAGMNAVQRANSLKGAFQVRAPRGVSDRGVLVIDDVMTTSATANAVTRALLQAGASDVSILTIGRVSTAPLWGKRLALA